MPRRYRQVTRTPRTGANEGAHGAMNDTFEPTVERLRHTFHAVADQVVDAAPAFHAVPVTVATAASVIDLESARRVRTGRRRWPVTAAAVVAAVLLVAGTSALAVVISRPDAPP